MFIEIISGKLYNTKGYKIFKKKPYKLLVSVFPVTNPAGQIPPPLHDRLYILVNLKTENWMTA